ncbi:MAG TPA: translation initiation factor Sui1 [Candidatus Krumholzibacteria bacterium]|nr:translation initiation factor Sui1 [Candidatus Krumholzibacteria bacterium]
MAREGKDRGLVWSSEGGSLCPECGQPTDTCRCRQGRPAPAGDGTVRVFRESKGRGGKTVTVVRGLALDAAALDELARDLKRQCGVGGSVKDGAVEIQGDQREKVVALLQARGIKAKPAGG